MSDAQPITGLTSDRIAERVFLCGEAYSVSQGWVEGALNTAERMLEEHFGLPRPAWVHPDGAGK